MNKDKISDLNVGDTVYCMTADRMNVFTSKVAFRDYRYIYVEHKDLNFNETRKCIVVDGYVTYTEYGEFICPSKDALLKTINDRMKILKKTRSKANRL